MAEKPTVDLPKAAERYSEAQEAVKLTHAAMQASTKAWDGIRGPSPAKRSMWKALQSAREGFVAACAEEKRRFAVMDTLVGQGDLFDGAGEPEPDGPKDPPAGDPPAGRGRSSKAVVVKDGDVARVPPERRLPRAGVQKPRNLEGSAADPPDGTAH